MNDPLLRCDALQVGYAGQPLLPPISVGIQRGELLAVLGRNGSGKTTFFKTLLGLVPSLGGTVVRPEDHRVAYLAQRMDFDDLYPVSVYDVVAAGTLRGWSFLRPGHDAGAVAQAMEAVGVQDLASRSFRSLSGGQRQRVLFARMLASGATLVFLDEPTVGMDAVAEAEVMQLLQRLRLEYGLTVVVITHYLQVARDHAQRVLFLDPDGPHVLLGTPDEVFVHPAFVSRYGTVLGAEHG